MDSKKVSVHLPPLIVGTLKSVESIKYFKNYEKKA
jgi:hypothetical protein